MTVVYLYKWNIHNRLNSNNVELIVADFFGRDCCFFTDSWGDFDVRFLNSIDGPVEYRKPLDMPPGVRVYKKYIQPVDYRFLLWECFSRCVSHCMRRMTFQSQNTVQSRVWLLDTLRIADRRIELDSTWTLLAPRNHFN